MMRNPAFGCALLALILSASLGGVPARAAPALSAEDNALVAAVERYLNEMTTLRAKFVQVSSDGGYAEGMFWLRRPGLARFEYAPPVNLLLVADGLWLIFFDADVDQVTHLPISTGPFRFLLDDHASLTEDVEITALAREAGVVRITMADPENRGEGSETLALEEFPMRLRQWQVVDAQGRETRVTLGDEVYGLELDRDLFYFTETSRNHKFRRGVYN